MPSEAGCREQGTIAWVPAFLGRRAGAAAALLFVLPGLAVVAGGCFLFSAARARARHGRSATIPTIPRWRDSAALVWRQRAKRREASV